MKQRVSGGLFAGLACVLVASCGGGGDGGSANAGESGNAVAGNAGSSAPSAGSQGSAGAKAAGSPATASAGTGGTTGTTSSPVSSSAGTGASTAPAGMNAAVAGMLAAAGAGGATTAAGAGGSAMGSAGKAGSTAAASGDCGSESFAAIYDTILKNTTYNCAGALCHGREPAMAMTVGNLSLSSASVAYMQLVKVDSTSSACSAMPRVVPGDPAGSLLVQKLRSATTTCGGVMPVGADEIAEADLKRITDWITAGACDN